MMNFWTPTFQSWGQGLDATNMPWYVLYDYVETFTYNSETNGFDFHWRDDFITFDPDRWHKSDNTTFDANSTTFRASQSYISQGHLVLKMEPDTPVKLHEGQYLTPTEVEPVRTEPTFEHAASKGVKAQKGDEHYDVLAEQRYAHIEHAQDLYDREGHYFDPYYDPYGVGEHEPQGPKRFYEPHGQEHLLGGAEAVGAHLRPYQQEYAFAHHAEAPHHVEAAEHYAEPLHSIETHPHAKLHIEEPHVSSTPKYYDEMFGGHMDGIKWQETQQHRQAAQAHHPEVSVYSQQQDEENMLGLQGLIQAEESPYEGIHVPQSFTDIVD